MSDATPDRNMDSLLGDVVVKKGLATAEQVSHCRALQSSGGGESLGLLLVREGMITESQLARLEQENVVPKGDQQIPGFQILSRLGAGAMATVYKARQISLDRQVAIKVLPQKYTDNQEFVRRFYDEGRAAAKLNHPNIVGALDVGQAGQFHYFVMEYVEGDTVYDFLQQHRRYTEEQALKVAIEMARALAHAHKAGFVHRDVKPKNIMLTRDGVAKLADMGLARAVSDREAAEAEAGKAYGTPYYISPEQIRGERDIDARADIYSLGATLYHMVTGQVPYEGANPGAVMHKHLKADLVPPDHVATDLTSGFSEIIEVCMAKSPDQRYGSAAELLSDLEAVARGEAPRQARRRFDLAALSALEEPESENGPVALGHGDAATPLMEQPVFWIAASGWAVALLFAAISIILLARG